MERLTEHRSETGDTDLVVRSEWSNGPRTPAWDRLWRAILRDLDPEPHGVPDQQLGREGDDG
jgi:hypothetical protein